jgi:hypothetical protein
MSGDAPPPCQQALAWIDGYKLADDADRHVALSCNSYRM